MNVTLSGSVGGGVPVSEILVGSGELWLLPKELYEKLETILKESEPSEEHFREVDRLLTRHAADFASVFQIKIPNPVDRAELKKLGTEGALLAGYSGKQVIDYTLVNEAVLLSDLFSINEFLALDLLTIAEYESENYAGWPRGLIAVYMFYEGRLWLIATLYKILRFCSGRTWQYRLHSSILQSFQRTLNSVFSEDLMDRLIVLLDNYNLTNQIDKLESNLALGDFRHRRTVKTLLYRIRESLTCCIFCYMAQRKEVRWVEVMRVLDYLKEHISPPEEEHGIMKDDIILITSILFITERNLHPSDCNIEFGLSLRKYLRENEQSFKCMEIWDLFRLGFLINAYKVPTESGAQSAPQTPQPGPHGDSFAATVSTSKSLLSEDSDFEFTRNVFGFLQKKIFSKPELYSGDEIYSKVFHTFFTDFITHMPLKLNEMKYHSEEAARTALICQTQGINCPAGFEDRIPEYQSFLECLGEFYEHEQHELGSFFFLENNIQFLPLAKLVRSCCMESPSLFLSALCFLNGVSNGNPSAMFELLHQEGHNVSLEHFFDSILKYVNSFVGKSSLNLGTPGRNHPVVPTSIFSMNPVEIKGFCAYLRLVATVCTKHEGARKFFTSQKSEWIRKLMEMSKMTGAPREIKASMLNTISAIIGEEILSPEVVSTLWDSFYSSKLVDPTGISGADLREELHEVESRLETYTVTIGMLRMMKSLIKSRFQQIEFITVEGYAVATQNVDNGAIFPYIHFVTDHVFLKAPFRVYKNPEEKWLMIQLCVSIISILIDYVPNLMLQLLCDSPLIKTLLNIISDCALVHEISHSAEDGLHAQVNECSLECLNLLYRALQRQPVFLMKRNRQGMRYGPVLVGIHDLIMTVGVGSSKPEYILSLLRFIDTLMTAEHRLIATNILCLVIDGHSEMDSLIHAALEWHEELAAVFRYTLIEALYYQDSQEVSDELKLSVLKLLRVSVKHPSPNIGFFLLGVDSSKMDYKENSVRSILQALLDTAIQVETSFETLLTLLKHPRLSRATLGYLQRSKFFLQLVEHCHFEEMSFESLCYFMKCLAIEMKTEGGANTASLLASSCFQRLEQVLERIQLEVEAMEMPNLEIFDGLLLKEAIFSCESQDAGLNTRLIQVELLEGMLKEEINKLEKTNRDALLKLRKSLLLDTNRVLSFARQINAFREKEGKKLLAFEGWCQTVEVLMLTANLPRKFEFVTNILRLLINKVLQTTSKGSNMDSFHRLAAETCLTGTVVLKQIREEEPSQHLPRQGLILPNIVKYISQWISIASSSNVRGVLYAALLHVINIEAPAAMTVCQESFHVILDVVARDCCQAQETTKLQALYVLGEILRCTTQRGFGSAGEPSNTAQQPEESSHDADSSSSFFDTSFVEGLNKTGLASTRLQTGPAARSGVSAINPGAVADSIMSCVLNNGFLSSLVESFCVVDDTELVTLLTTPQLKQNAAQMRAFFVFEAKMSMLTRLSQSGNRAVRHLLDLNLIKRLMDMNVFALHNYQTEDEGDWEENADAGVRLARDLDTDPPIQLLFSRKGMDSESSTPSQFAFSNQNSKGRNGTGRGTSSSSSSSMRFAVQGMSESLFAQVFKLFHVMFDSAPGNVTILEHILQFLKQHDEAMSYCLSQRLLFRSGANLDKSSCAFLLTSLMTKLSQNVAAVADSGFKLFPSKSSLKLSLLNILRIQAQRNNTNDWLVKIVKNTLLFLYYHSRSKENSRSGKHGSSDKLLPPKRSIVLTKKLEMDHLLRDPQESCSMGVIIQLVSDCANHIANSQQRKVSTLGTEESEPQQTFSSSVLHILPEKVVEDMAVIVEVGLSLIFFHVELFIQEFPPQRRLEAKQWKQQLHEKLEAALGKQVTDACKKLPESEYIQLMLLKLRRLAVGSSTSSN